MTIRQRLIASLSAAGVLAAASLGAVPARAETCGADGHWCSSQCGAWNNWCRPACGDWNAWCAGQSLPKTLSGMQPRSYFADPKWQAPNYARPEDEDAAAQPKRKRRGWRRN
jgi:hypothetical protein